MSQAPRVCVVIPVYNQAHLLLATLDEVQRHLEVRSLSWEIVVVSDGCTDGVEGVLDSFCRQEPRCRLIRLPQNRGKGAAVRRGVLGSRADRILFSDVDLSTPISELDKLWAALDTGADIAIASRLAPGAQVVVAQRATRRVLGGVFRGLVRFLTDLPHLDFLCGFKLFTREAADCLFEALKEERFVFDVELLCRARDVGLRVVEVPVVWREAPESTVRPLREAAPALLSLLSLTSPARRARAAELLLLLVGALVLLVALGQRALWGIEGRWAEGARWILITGDLLTPRIDGAQYLLKPAPSYWLIVVGSWHGVTEISARIPSVLGALLAVMATVRLGRLWYGRDVGLLAGAILLSVGLFVFWGRTASGDMLTVGLATWAILLGERFRRRPRASAKALYLIAALCALGSLVKGLLGFALPAVSMAALVLADQCGVSTRRRRSLGAELESLWSGGHLVGAAALAAAIYLAPFLAERLIHGRWDSTHYAFAHSVGRFFGELEDHGSKGPLFYSYYILVLAAPWSLWLPFALVRPLRGKSLAWFCALFAFFTLSSSRRSYYLLPILPATALLVARAWLDTEPCGPLRVFLRRGPLILITGMTFAAALGAMLVPDSITRGALPGSLPPRAWSALAFALCGVALLSALRADRRGESRRAAWLTVGAFLLGTVYAFWVVLPATESDRTRKPFAIATRARVGLSPLAIYGNRDSSILDFYLGREQPLDRVPDLNALSKYRGYVVASAREATLPPGWRVVLRERLPPPGADPAEVSSCVRCSVRGRPCKHYLLLGRD